MAKGNYASLQYLKPTEIKNGELYSSWVDGYIKRGDAERAMALKRAQEEGKSLEDLMKDVKVEHATTITPWQNERNRLASDGIDLVGNARMMATNMNIPIEQRRAYADKARNYANQIAELDTLIKDPKLIEQYANNVKTTSEGKAFKGDPRLGLYMSVEAGLAKFRTNKDGMLEVGYIENTQDPDKKEKWELLSEVKQKYMTPIEESTVESYNKYLVDLAQKVTTETTTSNGYVRTYNKAFDAKDAKTLLMTSFGLDPSKEAKDNFNVNNIPRQLNHRFYDKNTRPIQSAADLEEAINDSVLTMKTAADEKTSREVLKTADDITLDKLQIANARKNLYKQDAPSGGSAPTVSIVTSGTVTRKYTDPKVGESTVDYSNGVVINLKNKEFIAGYKVPNSNGKGYHNEYFIIGNDEKGRQTIESGAKTAEVFSKFQGYGIDPLVIDRSVSASEPIKKQNIKKGNKVGAVKYYQSYRPATESESENLLQVK